MRIKIYLYHIIMQHKTLFVFRFKMTVMKMLSIISETCRNIFMLGLLSFYKFLNCL